MENVKTIIQSINSNPYVDIVVLPFLYETPKNTELYIDDVKYIIDHMRDKIENGGSITRLIRCFDPNKPIKNG